MIIHRLPDGAKALIFDIDNTLYSDPAYGEAQTRVQIERLAAERGKSVAETETELDSVRADYALEHGGAKTSLANAFALLGVAIETSVAWRLELLKPEEYLKKDRRLITSLKTLSRRFRLAALTNNPVEVGRKTLECLGVGHFFPDIVGLDTCGLSKPSPEPFQETLKRLGRKPAECVSIGDRFDVDLKVPLDMGMGAIQVDGVADVYALPETLIRKPGLSKNLLRGLCVLPLAFAILAVSSSVLRWRADVYSMPLIDKADGRLDAKMVANCYLKAYPEIVTEAARDEMSGEWTLTVRGERYSYANGRWTLPSRAEKWADYRPYIDAIYPWKLVEPSLLPESVLAHLRKIPETQDDAPPSEGNFAFSLYGGDDQRTVYARQVRMKLLGWPVTVHEVCAPSLAKVDAQILAAAKTSPRVKDFVDSIGSLGGYNWRYIRGQKELSRHSFGIAVDILPKDWKKRSVYWLWDMEKGIDWAVLPLAARWSPPEEVVDIFESNGFIWGGKWLVYDTMHFEYRPEILRLRDRMLPKFLSVLK